MEKKEFEILSIRIRPKLLSVARNFALVSGIEADDVVQEALIALWELVEQDYSLKNIDSLAIRITKKHMCFALSQGTPENSVYR